MEQVGPTRQTVETELAYFLPEGEEKYTSLQLHFLRRLHRLLRLRQEQGDRLSAEGARLLDRAIFSSYCDCVDEGAAADAQEILRRVTARVPQSDN